MPFVSFLTHYAALHLVTLFFVFFAQVITSNGVFNSMPAIVSQSTWPLPPTPTPVIQNTTNTSVVFTVDVGSVVEFISSYYVTVLVQYIHCTCITHIHIYTDIIIYTYAGIHVYSTCVHIHIYVCSI